MSMTKHCNSYPLLWLAYSLNMKSLVSFLFYFSYGVTFSVCVYFSNYSLRAQRHFFCTKGRLCSREKLSKLGGYLLQK